MSGWVYGGAIEFIEKPAANIANKEATIFFPPELIQEIGATNHKAIQQIINDFDEITTAAMLFDYYNGKIKALKTALPEVANGLYEGRYDELTLSCVLKVFSYTQLCSECAVELYINSEAFLEKAKMTPAKIDDQIFQLLYDAVGDYNSFDVGALSEHDCDFCWHSILGDGQIFEFWKRIQTIWKIYNNNQLHLGVDDLMNDIERYLLWEMDSRTYMYTKEKVLQELKQIEELLETLPLSDNLMASFEATKTKLENEVNVTFGCENQDCATLVMKELFPDN